MPSLHAMEARIAALEARIADIEGGYGQTLYRNRRDLVGLRIEVGSLLDQAGLSRATDARIDAVLDQE